MTETTKHNEAIEAVRNAVLGALDTASESAGLAKWNDDDLPELFRTLDALAVRLSDRKGA